eukprot:6394113-Pyramimonas_sp.AAC.1
MASFCECIDDRGRALNLLALDPKLVCQLGPPCMEGLRGFRVLSSEFPTGCAGTFVREKRRSSKVSYNDKSAIRALAGNAIWTHVAAHHAGLLFPAPVLSAAM